MLFFRLRVFIYGGGFESWEVSGLEFSEVIESSCGLLDMVRRIRVFRRIIVGVLLRFGRGYFWGSLVCLISGVWEWFGEDFGMKRVFFFRKVELSWLIKLFNVVSIKRV